MCKPTKKSGIKKRLLHEIGTGASKQNEKPTLNKSFIVLTNPETRLLVSPKLLKLGYSSFGCAQGHRDFYFLSFANHYHLQHIAGFGAAYDFL